MYVDEFGGNHVKVKYIYAHQGHELCVSVPFLPIPQRIKQSIKLSLGVTSECILGSVPIIDWCKFAQNNIDFREEVRQRI